MKVILNGQEFKFEFDSIWGAMYTYEELTADMNNGKGLPFDPHKTRCIHLLFWCILLNANPDFTIMPDEFIMMLNDLELARQMMDYYNKRMLVLTAGVDKTGEDKVPDDKKKD